MNVCVDTYTVAHNLAGIGGTGDVSAVQIRTCQTTETMT